MTHPDSSPLPPRGQVAQVRLTAALEHWPMNRAKLPPGVFCAADGFVIFSHGDSASALRLESAADAAALAVAILAVGERMEVAEAEAAARADDALGRVLAEREAAGNG